MENVVGAAETYTKSHKWVLWVGGGIAILFIAYTAYSFYVNLANANAAGVATSTQGGGTSGTGGSSTPVDTTAQDLQDQLTYQQGLESIQQTQAISNEGLREQGGAFDTTNALALLTGQNNAAIALTTGQDAESLQNVKNQFDFLFGSGGVSPVTAPGAPDRTQQIVSAVNSSASAAPTSAPASAPQGSYTNPFLQAFGLTLPKLPIAPTANSSPTGATQTIGSLTNNGSVYSIFSNNGSTLSFQLPGTAADSPLPGTRFNTLFQAETATSNASLIQDLISGQVGAANTFNASQQSINAAASAQHSANAQATTNGLIGLGTAIFAPITSIFSAIGKLF